MKRPKYLHIALLLRDYVRSNYALYGKWDCYIWMLGWGGVASNRVNADELELLGRRIALKSLRGNAGPTFSRTLQGAWGVIDPP